MKSNNALSIARSARKGAAKPNAKAPLGNGGRFAALQSKIAANGNVQNPAAVAAAIGRRKYGAKKMAKMSAAGRRSS